MGPKQENVSGIWLPWNGSRIEDKKSGVIRPDEDPDDDGSTAVIDEVPIGNKSWGFWSNNSLSKSVDSVHKRINRLKSNTLYTETMDLNQASIPNIRCGTSVIDTSDIVVPSFEESLPENTYKQYFYSLLSKVSVKLGYDQGISDNKHLLRNRVPDTGFKNVLIIGVHGFFPTKYLRPFIGEPTGTSIKFMTEAENTFKMWLNKNKKLFANKTIRLSKIALEGEGKVLDRVAFFYDILAKHDLTVYDFIFVAAHSQGTPVSIILVSKLIETGSFGDLDKKRIGILAMAGISNGPFYGVNKKMFVRAYSAIENASMLELFEFQNSQSIQSLKYLESLKIVLNNNVKISFTGSIDDQLVPLYSSTCLHVQHPNIFRSIFIDTDSNTPEFLAKILNCALLLKNVGLNDHGIIKEISNALAGPLTGGGHSKLYNDFKVYDLAIKFFLYTNIDKSFETIPVQTRSFDVSTLGNNPYHLPWCLRGLMYDSIYNLPNGKAYVLLMFQDFDLWNPATKPLKEIKYRLNAIRAKL